MTGMARTPNIPGLQTEGMFIVPAKLAATLQVKHNDAGNAGFYGIGGDGFSRRARVILRNDEKGIFIRVGGGYLDSNDKDLKAAEIKRFGISGRVRVKEGNTYCDVGLTNNGPHVSDAETTQKALNKAANEVTAGRGRNLGTER